MLRYTAAAWLSVTVVAFVVLGEMSVRFPHWLIGIVAWTACALLWPRLTLAHAMGLSQAFIVGALWSPFYGRWRLRSRRRLARA